MIFEDHLLSPMDPMDIYWPLLTHTLDPTTSRPPIMLVSTCDPINLKRISLNSILALFYFDDSGMLLPLSVLLFYF